MHLFIRVFLLLVIGSMGVTNVCGAERNAQEISDQITSALAQGDAKVISKHFHSSVQLILLDSEGMYNREQAEQILRIFFSQHQPTNFTVRHEGGSPSKDSRFTIGILRTGKGIYRVSLLLKIIDGNLSIYQLRIEEDNV